MESLEKLSPDHLIHKLYSNSNSLEPTIIYVGVGTHCSSGEWDLNYNQQFPLFIRDWKLSNFNTKIQIILFDEVEKSSPYIVTSKNDFYSGSFTNDKYSNVYTSELGIEVYSFDVNVDWTPPCTNYCILDLMVQLIIKTNESNHLLFFHEYTGRNCSIFDYEIRQIIEYNEAKVCIDISRGKNLSCFVDFGLKENYPLITTDEFGLQWKNPKYFSLEEIAYYKDKNNSTTTKEKENEYLISGVLEQYLSKKNYVIDYCKEILTIMRLSYMNSEILKSKEKEYNVKIFCGSQYINNISNLCVRLISKLADRITDFAEIIRLTQEIIKCSILNITDISDDKFIELFTSFDSAKDKYRLYPLINDFLYTNSI
jgi:hypothetical protein